VTLFITSLIVVAALMGFLGLSAGLLAGFLFGTLNRVFFRYQFNRWVSVQFDDMQAQFKAGLDRANAQAQETVAQAQAQTQKIYRLAAEHVVANKVPGVTAVIPDRGPVN
jgi:hypothetical protein